MILWYRFAIARRADYAKVNIPMLPFLMRMSGVVYLGAAALLDAGFLRHALRLNRSPSDAVAMRVFRYSIIYLMWLFLALLLDHYLPTTQRP